MALGQGAEGWFHRGKLAWFLWMYLEQLWELSLLAMAACQPTNLLVDRVHIHFFGNGHLGFRPYGDSLFLQAPKKSKQKKARPERPAPR